MKKLITALTLCFALGFSTFAYAAEPIDDTVDVAVTEVTNSENSARAMLAYESTWLNGSSDGSFPITINQRSTGVTFKVEAPTDNSWAAVELKYPNGRVVSPKLQIGNLYPSYRGGEGYAVSYTLPAGTYYVSYAAYAPSGMRIMCWIY